MCKAYSNAFNNRSGHRGSLFEGSYKALAITNDEYLHQLCRYIHANPVRHGFTNDPALWPYSNYHEWVGSRCGTLVDRQLVQEHFPVAGAYQAYVMSYVRHEVVLPVPLGQYLDASDGV